MALSRIGCDHTHPQGPSEVALPRAPRCAPPGCALHVWARGIERRLIFVDDRDRLDFVERMALVLPESDVSCFGWVLMSNHVHLVVRCRRVPLSTVMSRLLTGFATSFNRRHERCGHLFQNRFGSRLIRDDDDLRNVIRYVIRNPLEAGLSDSENLRGYRWSVLQTLLGDRAAFPFESVDEVLALFGGSRQEARTCLNDFLRNRAEDLEPRAASSALAALVSAVCAEAGIAEADLRAGRRTAAVSKVRVQVCRRALRELDLAVGDIAGALGVTKGAVSQALRRGVSKRRGTSPF